MELNHAMRIEFDVSEAERLFKAMDIILLSKNIFGSQLPQDVYLVCEGLLNCSKDFLSNLRSDLL